MNNWIDREEEKMERDANSSGGGWFSILVWAFVVIAGLFVLGSVAQAFFHLFTL